MVGIPYAKIVGLDPEDGSGQVIRQCPVCLSLITEATDSFGEQTTNAYAAHYAEKHTDATDDEAFDADGTARPYGRCDTCGAPCTADGCTVDPAHEVALP